MTMARNAGYLAGLFGVRTTDALVEIFGDTRPSSRPKRAAASKPVMAPRSKAGVCHHCRRVGQYLAPIAGLDGALECHSEPACSRRTLANLKRDGLA